ncbi:hypothetical protein BUALT_Bualt11G0124200 [Buddleja alternifolia]|uniref:SHSP domain-containing protein n=1 Tax=Buddleja alternifolia TaxID=168488 RepID=A0AAV6WW86_9LAMI|nr:hypothetical protein BUALT_Bualt11G0124200 [Buddleja alternifolia]
MEPDSVKKSTQSSKNLKILQTKRLSHNSKCPRSMLCRRGKFMRTFSLPENCKTDHVTSSFENGVLKVTVPKKDVKNNYSHVKNIQVN